jgi:hypothetical protein
MIAEAGAAISGIKIAMDMAKGIAALKSETEINQAVIDIQRTLLDAQSAALSDKNLIAELHDKARRLQSEIDGKTLWAVEAQKYALGKSPRGVFYYQLRPELAGTEIGHFLCTTCFDNGRKSILHASIRTDGGDFVQCHVCKIDVKITNHAVTSLSGRTTMF